MSYVPGLSSTVANRINPYTGEPMYRTNTDSWLFNIIASMSPVTIKKTSVGSLQSEATRVGAITTGLSGTFTINGESIELDGKTKEKYAIERADYVESKFDDVISNKEKITILRESSYITTTYDKLTDDEKKSVISSIYTQGTNYAKIKYWSDSGNWYITSNLEEYKELRKTVKNVKYIANYKGSKFKQ